MNKQEFLEYVSNPDNANRVAGSIDIATWHLGFDAILKELEATNIKDKEAVEYMLENKVPTNFLGYIHLKPTPSQA